MAKLYNLRGLFGNASRGSIEKNIEDLRNSLRSAKATIYHAKINQDMVTHEIQEHVKELQDVSHEAEDLLDKLVKHKVRWPLSLITMSNKINHLRERLDEIGSKLIVPSHYYYMPTRTRRKETRSYVPGSDIIGREEVIAAIKRSLISATSNSSTPPIQQFLSVVCIVGVPGIGKTALAQLVFHDLEIQTAFDLKFWVCVGEDFSIKEILCKILVAVVGGSDNNELELDELKEQVRQVIQEKKFLLVLDDVCCEDPNLWHQFTDLLTVTREKGSRILLTSCSIRVALVIQNSCSYELEHLSKKHSWNLFATAAFPSHNEPDPELVHIARLVTLRCFNHPLTIRVVASTLSCQEKNGWLTFRNADVTNSPAYTLCNPLLFKSFQLLTPELRRCFEFCLVFPRNHVIEMEVLINMWLGLGYLIPVDGDQTLEEIGEEYCLALYERNFFQDIQIDEYGNIICFKIHELLHTVCEQEAGEEYLMLTNDNIHRWKKKIRHLSISKHASPIKYISFFTHYPASETLHTIFNLRDHAPWSSDHVSAILLSCTGLKLLDLHAMSMKTLPDRFDRVPNLTYLDLSDNEKLEKLPTSITKLPRLQVLRLRGCKNLEKLPDDMGRLVKLRYLDLSDNEKLVKLPTTIIKLSCLKTLKLRGCKNLEELPEGMDKLVMLMTLDIDGCNKLARVDNFACLQMHTMNVVGCDNSKLGNRGKLINMEPLVNLKGNFLIKVETLSLSNMPEKGNYILRDAHLQGLDIICADWPSNQGVVHETSLKIQGYIGTQLTTITLSHFGGLQHLTTLSQLHHLKYLHLLKLWNVESIEGDVPPHLRARKSMLFFPSLEELVLELMPKLKGWWRELTWMEMEAGGESLVDGNNRIMEQLILPAFPRLHDLRIRLCQSMIYFPSCPYVKVLDLRGVNEVFSMKGRTPSNPVAPESSNSRGANSALDKLIVCYNPRVLESLFKNSVVPSAVDIELKYFFEAENLQVAREGFERCSSSLKHLSIDGLYKLKSLSGGGIEHLTSLQFLTIKDCVELDLEEVNLEEKDKGMLWKSLRSLSSLKLDDVPKLVNLPKGFQYLTALQSLHIKSCSNLKAVGECFSSLTSLQSLHIEDCNNLEIFPECLGSLTTLQSINLDNCNNLEAQTEWLNSLLSRQILHIKNCPKLESAAPVIEIGRE